MVLDQENSKRFTCKRCGYGTNIKKDVKKHFERKTPCSPVLADICRDELVKEFVKEHDGKPGRPKLDKYQCTTCSRQFTSPASRYQHSLRCSCSIVVPDAQRDSHANTYAHEHIHMRNGIDCTRSGTSYNRAQSNYGCDISGNTITNNGTINNNVNIIYVNPSAIRAFGNEDTSFLTEERFKKYLNNKASLITQITRDMCDKSNYVNNNILVTSKKCGNALVYDGMSYNTEDKKQIYLQRLIMYRETIAYLRDEYDLSRKEEMRVMSVIDYLNTIIEEGEKGFVIDETLDEESAHYIKELIRRLDSIFYDNRKYSEEVMSIVMQSKPKDVFLSK